MRAACEIEPRTKDSARRASSGVQELVKMRKYFRSSPSTPKPQEKNGTNENKKRIKIISVSHRTPIQKFFFSEHTRSAGIVNRCGVAPFLLYFAHSFARLAQVVRARH